MRKSRSAKSRASTPSAWPKLARPVAPDPAPVPNPLRQRAAANQHLLRECSQEVRSATSR